MPEKSCWGVIFKWIDNHLLYLIIQENSWLHWAFPKGHVEPWETEQETALREIYEETGLQVNIVDGFRDTISYIDHTKNIEKTVVLFIYEWVSWNVTYILPELENYAWLPFEEALQRLTHDNSKELLKKVNLFLQHT